MGRPLGRPLVCPLGRPLGRPLDRSHGDGDKLWRRLLTLTPGSPRCSFNVSGKAISNVKTLMVCSNTIFFKLFQEDLPPIKLQILKVFHN